jgi:hypothetical protein
MGKPSFATPAGVKSGGISFKGGTTEKTCPLDKPKVKPSDDKCRCCSGDEEYSGTTFYGSMFYIAKPASIRLL